ncbi:MAG: amidohydrolase family protein, partial [Candidatus Marinimicrobia bacterium]|nr:amidohydrolase family protein [Candidatus Neomarinimicrobiota bacterium]
NTVRKKVMGAEDRSPTAEEMEQMKQLVERAMAEGAVGMSTGLKYIPGAYSKTGEVVKLAKVAADYGGFYATHMREEGLGLFESVAEAIQIGTEAGVPVQISHHKAVGKSMWGGSEKTLQMIDAAARTGLDITVDQYPYPATSTGLTVVFPAWSLAGEREELKNRLDDSESRARIKKAIVNNILFDRGGGDPASIVVSSYAEDTSLEGKNLAEITQMRGMSPTADNAAEVLMELVYAGKGSGIYHCLHEDDIKRIMQHPRTMHASDGSTIEFGAAKPHPRSYGTYPRVLGRYVREEGVISLEEAIRKMTSLPAQRLSLQDRGLIKEGMWADIVVFDPDSVIDTATWLEPHRYPEGIPYVLVNGRPVIDGGNRTEVFSGKILYGAGKKEEK